MKPVLRLGLARLRRDRTRAALTAAGIATAAAMIGAAATVVFALSSGFDRTAARAGLAAHRNLLSAERMEFLLEQRAVHVRDETA